MNKKVYYVYFILEENKNKKLFFLRSYSTLINYILKSRQDNLL